MTKVSHQIIGILSAYLLQLPVFPAYFSSTLPDIDLKWQKGGKGGLLYSHRGITHHIILCLFFLIVFFYVDNVITKSLIVGYISHIFADIMTKKGVPYWGYKDRISLNLFRTGSKGEYIFVIGLIGTFAIVLFLTNSFYLPLDFQIIFNFIWGIFR